MEEEVYFHFAEISYGRQIWGGIFKRTVLTLDPTLC